MGLEPIFGRLHCFYDIYDKFISTLVSCVLQTLKAECVVSLFIVHLEAYISSQ